VSNTSEIKRLRRDCSELYQVIGTMAEHCPDAGNPAIIKALDNASAAAAGTPRPHDDLLPFVLPESPVKIWLPIETAPRDGTHFLAYGNGAPERAIVYDTKTDWQPRIRICWRLLFDSTRDEDAGDGLFRKVAYVADLGWEGGVHFDPTHWMPIPAAPQALSSGQGTE
jgi:hypothetical protein